MLVTSYRGGSRNVEGGVLVLCRAIGSNFVLGLALRKAVIEARSAENFFHLQYSVVWIGSHTTGFARTANW